MMDNTQADGSVAGKVTDDPNWQATIPTVRERNEALFTSELMADVYFTVGKSDEKQGTRNRIPAHKLILSAGSSVFYAMFYGALREEKDEILISDIGESAFLVLLRYLYYDEIKLEADSVMETLYASKKYFVPHLTKACTDFLITNIDVNNACSILNSLIISDEPKVIQQCFKVIDSETELAVKAECFCDINMETLKSILARDTVSCKEVCIFEAALKWATAECDRKDLEPIPANKRAVLGDLWYLIRFPTMSAEEFADKAVPMNILSLEEIKNIFLHFTSKCSKPSIEYPIKRRCTVQVCHRFQSSRSIRLSNQQTNYSCHNSTENLRFTVDKRIFLVGFGIYGPSKGIVKDYSTIIELKKGGRVLARNNTTFSSDGSSPIYRVYFHSPIQLEPNSYYNPCFSFNRHTVSGDFYCGQGGMMCVIVDGITFTFACSCNYRYNCTDECEGQIPEIIFSLF